MKIYEQALKNVEEHNEKVNQGIQHYNNISDITQRFLAAISTDADKFNDFYPLWAEQMDKTMMWFVENEVNDKDIMDLFDLMNNLFTAREG